MIEGASSLSVHERDAEAVTHLEVHGLIEDLDLPGHDYNIALSIFFVPYILFEVASNTLLMK